MNKPKLIDVANLAGVSKSTASQFINGRFDYMSKNTQAKLREAIKELDYVPNPIARKLKISKTKTIGVIVRDITGFDTSQTIRGIDDYCKRFGYNVIIYNSDFNSQKEADAVEALYQTRVDGIVIASSGKNTALMQKYIDKGLNLVHFQLEHDGSERYIVVSDYQQAAFDATEYLINRGHKNICFATQEFEKTNSRNQRYLGYVAALEKHNLPLLPSNILLWSRDSGFHVPPKSKLNGKTPPSAFFTQHLAITTDLLSHFESENILVPNDVAVIGFDDIPMRKFFKVPITVVKQAPYTIGEEAAKLMLNIIDDPKHAPKTVRIPCSIAKGASC